MSEQTSTEFKEYILLRFVKEILRNMPVYADVKTKQKMWEAMRAKEERSEKQGYEINQLIQNIQQQQVPVSFIPRPRQIRELIDQRTRTEAEKISEMKRSGLLPELKKVSSEPFIPTKVQIRKPAGLPPMLRIPEPPLPETVSYIRPVPTSEVIDLGRLNILVNDPLIKIIECNGADKNIVVMGIMGRKSTPLRLDKEEMSQVLERFSAAAKIPVNEGLFKAAVGNLVISAVVSEIVGIQFIIRKILQRY